MAYDVLLYMPYGMAEAVPQTNGSPRVRLPTCRWYQGHVGGASQLGVPPSLESQVCNCSLVRLSRGAMQRFMVPGA